MLKIAVCDDEQELTSEFGEALAAILGNLKVRGEIRRQHTAIMKRWRLG